MGGKGSGAKPGQYRTPVYTKNNDYWNIPTIENSYFAGFIAADGNIITKNNTLSIQVTEKDRSILDSFKVAIQYTGLVHYSRPKKVTKTSYRLWIGAAQKYIHDLEKWFNITPRKSLTLMPPNITDIDHIKAYIIGYFDGDGSLYWRTTNKKYTYPSICIVGTYSMICWQKEVLTNLTNQNYSIYRCKNKLTYGLKKEGLGVIKFLESLSDVNVPRLERKWDLVTAKQYSLQRSLSRAA